MIEVVQLAPSGGAVDRQALAHHYQRAGTATPPASARLGVAFALFVLGRTGRANDGDNPGYITIVTLVELYWVLISCYALTGEQVSQALDAILRTKQFLVERADQVMRALRVFGDGKADFADCLIERSAAGAGCDRTMTFDVGASKHAGMKLIS